MDVCSYVHTARLQTNCLARVRRSAVMQPYSLNSLTKRHLTLLVCTCRVLLVDRRSLQISCLACYSTYVLSFGAKGFPLLVHALQTPGHSAALCCASHASLDLAAPRRVLLLFHNLPGQPLWRPMPLTRSMRANSVPAGLSVYSRPCSCAVSSLSVPPCRLA
jgi:hypothetical protein